MNPIYPDLGHFGLSTVPPKNNPDLSDGGKILRNTSILPTCVRVEGCELFSGLSWTVVLTPTSYH